MALPLKSLFVQSTQFMIQERQGIVRQLGSFAQQIKKAEINWSFQKDLAPASNTRMTDNLNNH